MKTRILISCFVLCVAVAAHAAPAGRGNAGANRGSARPPTCDLSGPGQGTPLRDGSGAVRNGRGNPNSNGSPLRDGSGKASAPGKGPKDGTGNRAQCPVTPPRG